MAPKLAYFNGEIIPYEQANIGILNNTFNYGTGAFGGVRGYWNAEEEQLFIFRPIEHYTRLLQSAKLLRMEFDHTPQDLTQFTIELMRAEEAREDRYIRPIIYFADDAVGVHLHGYTPSFCMSSIPFDKYVANDTNAHVTFSSWRRVDDNMIPARGKIIGAYVNTALVKSDALLAGFDEALVLTQDGHVSEGSAENLFMVRNGKLVTPPITDNILEGITRRSVIELAQAELGLEVVERPIDRTEIFICEEFFMTGTAAQVTAITQVDHRKIGEGVMGPVTDKLRLMFNDLVRGKLEKYRHWNTPVYEK